MMDEAFMQPSTYNFLRLPPEFSDFEKSRFVVIQVPFDSTASYMGGARNGPHAIIRASREVELFDRELGEPYQDGIATLEEIDLARGDSERTVKMVSEVMGKIAGMGKIPVMFGGEHTITAGASMAFGKDVTFVVLDAHADLRDEYEGCKFSHACTGRRIAEAGNNIIGLGIRSISREEMDCLSENKKNVKVHFMDDVRESGLEPVLKKLAGDLKGRRVYLSIDIDALDPSEAPGTGTPEPGGFSYREALQIIRAICGSANVVGFDITEVSPIPGSHVTEFLAARLAYKAIGYIVRQNV